MPGKRSASRETTQEADDSVSGARGAAPKPTKKNLISNFNGFLKNLNDQDILPELLAKKVLEPDEYNYFRDHNFDMRTHRVDELLRKILEKEKAKPEVIKLLYEALRKKEYIDLSELLCTSCDLSDDNQQAKRRRRWEKVYLSELTEEEERLRIDAEVQILEFISCENTTAAFFVGEGDAARRLLVLLQSYNTDLDDEKWAPGSCLLLCDAAWVGDHLVVSSRNISRTGNVAVSEAGHSQAASLPRAAAATLGTQLKDIAEAPADSIHSAIVEIVSVELMKIIEVNGELALRKDCSIRDNTQEMAAELWRHMANTKIDFGEKWSVCVKLIHYNKLEKKVLRILKADRFEERPGTAADHESTWLSSNGHQEGELKSFESRHYYSCSTLGCSRKKLDRDQTCEVCGISSTDKARKKSVYAKLKVVCDGELLELTAFLPELSQLYAALGVSFDHSLPAEQLDVLVLGKMPFKLDDLVLGKMPFKLGVKYDDKFVVSNFRSRMMHK